MRRASHKASKAAPRVAIYTHKDPQRLVRELENERIHRKELLEIYAIDRELVTAWTQHLDRRMKLDVSISDGQLLVVLRDTTLAGSIERLTLPREDRRCLRHLTLGRETVTLRHHERL